MSKPPEPARNLHATDKRNKACWTAGTHNTATPCQRGDWTSRVAGPYFCCSKKGLYPARKARLAQFQCN